MYTKLITKMTNRDLNYLVLILLDHTIDTSWRFLYNLLYSRVPLKLQLSRLKINL